MIKNKKALSPVIATVLLITLVIAIAVLVFLAARSLVREQLEKFGAPIEDICEKVDFNVDPGDTSGNTINFVIANYGNIPINSFDLKEIKGGNSEIQSLEIFLNSGATAKKVLNFKMQEPNEIIFYPKVLGTVRGKKTNKAYTCLNQGINIKL